MPELSLPRWDMEVVFPSLDSAEFQAAVAKVGDLLTALEATFDALGVGTDQPANPSAESFDGLIGQTNETMDWVKVVTGYIAAFVSTDSRDDLARAKASEMDPYLTRLRKLGKRLTAWLGAIDDEALYGVSEVARDHAFVIQKAKVGAKHLMSPSEEALASDLEVTGIVAWIKLHGTMTSQLSVPATIKGEAKTIPLPQVRGLASDADREVRRNAYEAEIAGLRTIEFPMAAALNSVKGEVGELGRRRGWSSPLDEACEGNNISPATLSAMMDAADAAFPVFRRYLRAKARLLGSEQLRWYDLFAPVTAASRTWSYEEASDFLVEQFGKYSSRLADYAARAIRELWVDAEPREGKRDGAYCMSLRADESRIFMNYEPSFGSVSTLAHELGHGYHNLCLAHRTPLQRSTPMALAETASIFCETIIRQAILQNGTDAERLTILDDSLQGSTQVVVDITSRFRFEKEVFGRRKQRELAPREFCEIMLDSQRSTYGDGLDDNFLHPYMWIVKGHYYGRSFYNYPYMFGLLFGLGLYAIYDKDPEPFRARYDDLLSSTGMADAATLANQFGIDIMTGAFWEGSLRQIEKDVELFESLTKSAVLT